mmetsp:Transcript_8122/g.17557  ORF Transcript_8122/g.17557 Transcript_8122/m.17557 type:complete len:360 (+) Transcript_8122:130-1209(+)|eukprot:CAMPEP_0183739804 /NCGR_PEP_ID=MMETSP0737-20130205/58037_1 /TAXON_ID=385413 /ORGANISM="Thalassiosira miniscula, Strain CCMP1093" /LENGTH=359 /DNA_ID=CAMNT_0025974693 /DNA_START=47 /DNA_END=1126 /DNA_ORIENTATION=-
MTNNGNDPFACFGSSSSSSGSDDDTDDTRKVEMVDDLKEAHRLRDKSNSERPSALRDKLHDHQDSFEMFDAGPLAGKGLRAKVAYKCGDEIMREHAVMRIPNSQQASSQESAELMHSDAVQRAYNSMHETTQRYFMALSSSNEDGVDVAKTPQGIYSTNAFRLGNDPKGGLFLTIARINHSCRPNVSHFWSPGLQQKLIFASRDINVGEELLTIYGPNECMDTEGRRGYLNERFSFNCNCEMCREGNANGGDDRMLEIQSLQEDISLRTSGGVKSKSIGSALDDIKRCITLMKEQGIGGGAFTKSIYHHGYDICLAAGDDRGAWSYLNSELTAVRNSEGIDSPKAIEIEQVLNHFHIEF